MIGNPLALDDGLFVPVDAKPLQAFEDVGGKGVLGSFAVGIFDAKEEGSAAVAGKQPVENRCSSRSDMEGSCRAWSQTNANRHGGVEVWNGTDGARTRNFRRDRAVL